MMARSLRVLITRPLPDARRTARALRGRGISCTLAPLTTIVLHDDLAIANQRPGGVIATSRNGIRALDHNHQCERLAHLPLYCIGDETAALARDRGFSDIRSAGGNGHDLVALIRRDPSARRAPLLYVCACERTPLVEEGLSAHGYRLIVATGYHAVPATRLADAVAADLANGKFDAVLLYSRRAAVIFKSLVINANALPGLERTTLFCLSERIAHEFEGCRQAIVVASRPTEADLLRALTAHF